MTRVIASDECLPGFYGCLTASAIIIFFLYRYSWVVGTLYIPEVSFYDINRKNITPLKLYSIFWDFQSQEWYCFRPVKAQRKFGFIHKEGKDKCKQLPIEAILSSWDVTSVYAYPFISSQPSRIYMGLKPFSYPSFHLEKVFRFISFTLAQANPFTDKIIPPFPRRSAWTRQKESSGQRSILQIAFLPGIRDVNQFS